MGVGEEPYSFFHKLIDSGTLRDTLRERFEIRCACILLTNMSSGRDECSLPPDQPTKGTGMDLYEVNTHSFIVKIWLEETVEEAGRAMWRGHITHVPSGRRRYVKDLDDITTFIAAYLESMGVQFGLSWRMRQWLKQWKPF